MKSIRVAVVEDDPTFASMMVGLLGAADGIECVGTATYSVEAMGMIPIWKPDVAVLDVELPDKSGVELVADLRKLMPEMEIMMLTVFEDIDLIFGALCNGARGYLTKQARDAEILDAIRSMARGESPMSPSVARRLLDEVFASPSASSSGGVETELSPREWQVLQWVSKGHLNKEIAAELLISPETVRAHLYRIYRKLEVRSRGQAVRKVWPRLFGMPDPDGKP